MMSVMNKHPLRKSCTFCRARKIKCSNETICEACRKQNVDCVYDFEPYHRPSALPNTCTDSSVPVNEAINVQTEDRTSITLHRDAQQSLRASLDAGSARPDTGVEPAIPASEYVGPLLEAMFTDNFLAEYDSIKSTSWQRKIAALHRSVGPLRPPATSSSRNGSQSSRYASVWASITENLVECVIGKFGSLGSHQGEGGGSKLFINGLQRDDTASMFDHEDLILEQAEADILSDHCSRKTAQTIDIWFSNHPLSFLVSKTLLIHEFRAATHSELLLATMLADSYGFIGDEAAAVRSRSLLHFATSKLRDEVVDLPTASTSFSSQSDFHRRISTTQALLLLGWNALCRSEIRRATCYIDLASRMANHIMTQKWSSTPSKPGGRVNGIEVSEVIKETMAYLWCICFGLSLWLSAQVQEVSQLPHKISASAFLPITASSSVLISLDEASDNFSTLQKQKLAITDVWPVAHLSTVIGYIYALYPKESQNSSKTDEALWQESTLLALQRIQEPLSVQTFDSVCREIYRVLMENASLVNDKISHPPSRALVLMVYHTIGIHVLFPRRVHAQEYDDHTKSFSFTSELIDRVCDSTEEIIKILTDVHQAFENDTVSMVLSQLHPSSPEIFILALDSCARAISAICSRMGCNAVTPHDPSIFIYYKPRLKNITSRLFALTEDQFFCSRASLHSVRKQIKSIARSFRHQSSISTHRSRSESLSSTSSNSISPPDLNAIPRSASATQLSHEPNTMAANFMTTTHIPDAMLALEVPVSLQAAQIPTGHTSDIGYTDFEWKEHRGQPLDSIGHGTQFLGQVIDTADMFTVDVGDEWFQNDQMILDGTVSSIGAELNMMY